jgi:hypothetical protein
MSSHISVGFYDFFFLKRLSAPLTYVHVEESIHILQSFLKRSSKHTRNCKILIDELVEYSRGVQNVHDCNHLYVGRTF